MYCYNSDAADRHAQEQGVADDREMFFENKYNEIIDNLISHQNDVINLLSRLTESPISIEMLHGFFYLLADDSAKHHLKNLNN